jgi:transcriptional regulator with XRE-family HTH domain
MALRKLVGENVRRLRERKGWTQEQLAESAAFSSGLERGSRNPRVVRLYELAMALGVSHMDLVRCNAYTPLGHFPLYSFLVDRAARKPPKSWQPTEIPHKTGRLPGASGDVLEHSRPLASRDWVHYGGEWGTRCHDALLAKATERVGV